MIKKAVLAAAVAAATVVAATPATAAPPAPLDPQNWSFQDNLTWADYKKLPGPDYSDPSIQPTVEKWRVALIMVDYPDRPFTISQPAGSTIFGTPSAVAHSVPREQVPQFYGDFFNKPSALNNYQTHQPVLDGELLRQVRRGARARTARTGCRWSRGSYHIRNFSRPARTARTRRRHHDLQPELLQRRP